VLHSTAQAAYPERQLFSEPGDEQPQRSCLALLPAGVAWLRILLPAPVGSYPTFSPLPSLQGRRSVSVALSNGSPGVSPAPIPGVTRRCALWSADFPLTPPWWESPATHLASLGVFIIP